MGEQESGQHLGLVWGNIVELNELRYQPFSAVSQPASLPIPTKPANQPTNQPRSPRTLARSRNPLPYPTLPFSPPSLSIWWGKQTFLFFSSHIFESFFWPYSKSVVVVRVLSSRDSITLCLVFCLSVFDRVDGTHM